MLVGGGYGTGREIVTKSLALWTVFLHGMFVFHFIIPAILSSTRALETRTDEERRARPGD